MAIPFHQIPANQRTPLFFAEIDGSRANSALFAQRALIIGQITGGGTATPNIPVISQGVSDAKALGGPGSMLALMTALYRANDPVGELWYLPLADDGAAVAAAGSVLFAGPSTAAGVVSLYIGGQLVSVALASGTTANQAASALNTAIAAATDLPVTATVNTATVTITAKNAGLAGNDIDLRLNYLGAAGGQVMPTGLTATLTALTNGATNPVLTTGLANLLDQPFDVIVCPYNDATSLAALKALLSDSGGRWSYATQVYGHVFYAKRATFGGLTTFGLTQNDAHATCVGLYDAPHPNWLWAAGFAAAAAVSLRADPATPLQTVLVQGLLAPPLASRFSLGQRNTLLFDGISTFTVDQSGAIRIENMITTYQLNAFAQPDNSFLEIETLFTLMAVLRALAVVITTKYARVKLAADGTAFLPGSNVVTPSTIRADLIAQYRTLEAQGLVQQSALFAANLIVEQDANNPNRVNCLWPGTLIGQLRIFAALIQFRLQ